MKNLNRILGSLVFAGLCVWQFPVWAQMFGDDASSQSTTWRPSSSNVKKSSWWNKSDEASNLDDETTEINSFSENVVLNNQPEPKGPPEKVDVDNPEDSIYKAVPRVYRPTLDGVKRGTTSIYPVAYNGAPKAEDEPLIFLFYSDFNVNQLLSGTITCNVRFQIITTLDRKLSNLSLRLRWPEIETTLSFIDVPPNQMVHHDYTLVGNGCYSMDKIPNIIVNRCRVKGLSQQDCAAKIRWLKK